MVKVRKYSSMEEVRQAMHGAIERKKQLESLLRNGASKQEIEAANIKLVAIS